MPKSPPDIAKNAGLKRRLALKTLSGSAIAGALADRLPSVWQRPLVQASVLPAHAQGSPGGGGGGGRSRLPAGQPSQTSQLGFRIADLRTRMVYRTQTIDYVIYRDPVTGQATGVVFTQRRIIVQSPGLAGALFPAAHAQTAATTPSEPALEVSEQIVRFGETGNDSEESAITLTVDGESTRFPIRVVRDPAFVVPMPATLPPGATYPPPAALQEVSVLPNTPPTHTSTDAYRDSTADAIGVYPETGFKMENPGTGQIQDFIPPAEADTMDWVEMTPLPSQATVQFAAAVQAVREGDTLQLQITKARSSDFIRFDLVQDVSDTSLTHIDPAEVRIDVSAIPGARVETITGAGNAPSTIKISDVVIPQNVRSLSLPITPIRDQADPEDDESLVLTFDFLDPANIGTPDTATLTVTNRPAPLFDIWFEAAEYTITEGQEVTVNIGHTVNRGQAVNVFVRGVSGSTVGPLDYQSNPSVTQPPDVRQLRFEVPVAASSPASGNNPRTLTIQGLADIISPERDETLILEFTAEGDDVDRFAAIDNPAQNQFARTTVTITDVVPPVTLVEFAETRLEVQEGDIVEVDLVATGSSDVRFDIVRSGGATDLDLAEATLPGDGSVEVEGPPYDLTDITLTAPHANNGMGSYLFKFKITEDLLNDPETLTYSIRNVRPLTPGHLARVGPKGSINIQIANVLPDAINLPVVLEFAERTYNSREGETTNVVIRRRPNISGSSAVTISNIPVTATNLTADDLSVDQTALRNAAGQNATFTFADGFSNLSIPEAQASITLPIQWTEDNDNDTQRLQLQLVSAAISITPARQDIDATAGGNTSTTINVAQLQITSVQFSSTVYTGREGENAVIRINKTGASAITFDVALTHGTSQAADLGSVPNLTGLSIPVGQSFLNLEIPIELDINPENNNEIFTLVLTNPGGRTAGHSVTIGTRDQATVRITDAPITRIGFALATQSVNEGQSINIRINKSGNSAITFDVVIAPSGTTAATNDYSPNFPQTITLTAGQRFHNLQLQAAADSATTESDELLTLQIDNVRNPTTGHAVDINAANSATVISIVNDSPVTSVQFASATYSGSEGGTVTIRINKTGPSAATVEVSLAGGSANQADIDSPNFPQTVTFTGTQTEATIPLALNLDGANEGNETLILQLGTPTDGTAGHTLQLGSITRTTVTIQNASQPLTQVEFARATYSGTEGTDVAIQVDKTGASAITFDISVTYGTGAGSADHGSFTLTGHTIAAGGTSRTLTLPLATDSLAEGTETLTLTLTNIRGAQSGHRVGVGSQGTTRVTITDVAPVTRVQFASGTYSGTEGGNVTLVVNKTGQSAITFDISVPSAQVADIGNFNFTGHTIAANQNSLTLTLPLATDSLVEGSHNLDLTLTNARGATTNHAVGIGSQATTRVTITDVPPATAQLIAWASNTYSITEPPAGPPPSGSESNLSGFRTFETIAITRTGGTDVDVMFDVSHGNGISPPANHAVYEVGIDGRFIQISRVGNSGHRYRLAANRTTFAVRVYRDNETEGDETITLTLVDGTGYTFETTGNSHITTLTIRDNPPVVAPPAATTAAPPDDATTAAPVQEIGWAELNVTIQEPTAGSNDGTSTDRDLLVTRTGGTNANVVFEITNNGASSLAITSGIGHRGRDGNSDFFIDHGSGDNRIHSGGTHYGKTVAEWQAESRYVFQSGGNGFGISVTRDNLEETATESITFTLIPQPGHYTVTPGRAVMTVTITDNPPVPQMIGWVETSIEITEPAAGARDNDEYVDQAILVTRTGGSSDVNVVFEVTSQTASSLDIGTGIGHRGVDDDSDFVLVHSGDNRVHSGGTHYGKTIAEWQAESRYVFESGGNGFGLRVYRDLLTETDEQIVFTLIPQEGHYTVDQNRDVVTVTIKDNPLVTTTVAPTAAPTTTAEPAAVSWSGTQRQYSVTEPAAGPHDNVYNTQRINIQRNAAAAGQSVYFDVTQGSSVVSSSVNHTDYEQGIDVALTNVAVVQGENNRYFMRGDRSHVDVRIYQDPLREQTETITLTLVTGVSGATYQIDGEASVTISLVDNPPATTTAAPTVAPPPAATTTAAPILSIPAGERWYEWTWGPVDGTSIYAYEIIGEFRTTSTAGTITEADVNFHQYQLYRQSRTDGSGRALQYTIDLIAGTLLRPGPGQNPLSQTSQHGFTFNTSGTAFTTPSLNNQFNLSLMEGANNFVGLFGTFGGHFGLAERAGTTNLVAATASVPAPVIRLKTHRGDGGITDDLTAGPAPEPTTAPTTTQRVVVQGLEFQHANYQVTEGETLRIHFNYASHSLANTGFGSTGFLPEDFTFRVQAVPGNNNAGADDFDYVEETGTVDPVDGSPLLVDLTYSGANSGAARLTDIANVYFEITLDDDMVPEGNEPLVLEIVPNPNPDPNRIIADGIFTLGTNARTTVTIVDLTTTITKTQVGFNVAGSGVSDLADVRFDGAQPNSRIEIALALNPAPPSGEVFSILITEDGSPDTGNNAVFADFEITSPDLTVDHDLTTGILTFTPLSAGLTSVTLTLQNPGGAFTNLAALTNRPVVFTLQSNERYEVDSANPSFTLTVFDSTPTAAPTTTAIPTTASIPPTTASVSATTISFGAATYTASESGVVTVSLVKTGDSRLSSRIRLAPSSTVTEEDIQKITIDGFDHQPSAVLRDGSNPLVFNADPFTITRDLVFTLDLSRVAPSDSLVLEFRPGQEAFTPSPGKEVAVGNIALTTVSLAALPTTTASLPTALIEFVETSPVDVNEGDTLRIEFRVTGATSRVTFDLQRLSGSSAIRTDVLDPITGTSPGKDNLPSSGITELTADDFHVTGIQMNAATRSGSIYMMVVADATGEGAETLIFEIANVRNPDDGRAVAAGANNQITINIADTSTDPVMIGWAQPEYRVTEPAAGPSNQSSTEQIISITRTPARAADVKIEITTGPGVVVNPRGWSAYDDGVDFAITDQGFISQGQNAELTLSGTDTAFTVRVYRDAEAEAEETVTFTLVEGDGYTFDTTNNNHIATLVMVDNPPAIAPTTTATPTVAPTTTLPLTELEFSAVTGSVDVLGVAGGIMSMTTDADAGTLNVEVLEGANLDIQVSKTGAAALTFSLIRNTEDDSRILDADLDLASVTPLPLGDKREGGSRFDQDNIPFAAEASTLNGIISPILKIDELIEEDETLTFDLENVQPDDPSAHRAQAGTIKKLVITVIEVSRTAVGFSAIEQSVVEGGTATLTLNKIGPSAITVTIEEFTDAPPAQAADITSITYGGNTVTLPFDVTIPASDSTATIDVAVARDSLVEGQQYFRVRAVNPRDPNPQGRHVLELGKQTESLYQNTRIQIRDLTVAFAEETLQVLEPESGSVDQTITFNISPSGSNVDVYFTVSSLGTATEGTDYELVGVQTSTRVNAPDNERQLTGSNEFTLRVNTDTLGTEGPETIVLDLVQEGYAFSASDGHNQLTITITDSGRTPSLATLPVTIEFAEATYTGTEGGSTDVVIQRSGVSGSARVSITEVALSVTGMTADDFSIDLSGLTGATQTGVGNIQSLVIPEGQDSITLPISWTADADTELQSMTLTLTDANITADGGVDATVSGNGSTTITVGQIQNVGWAAGVRSVSEPEAGPNVAGQYNEITLSITRTGGTDAPVLFTASITGDLTQYTAGSTQVQLAGQGLSYDSANSQYQLAAGTDQFNLRLYRDNLADGDTDLTLTLVDSAGYFVTDRAITISLVDTPPQTVGWSSGDAIIQEPTAGDRSPSSQTGEYNSTVVTLDRGTTGTNQPVTFTVGQSAGIVPASDADLTQYADDADVRLTGVGLSYVNTNRYQLAGNTTEFTIELYRDRKTDGEQELTLRLEDGENYLVDNNNREITITLEDNAPQAVAWDQNTYRFTEPYGGPRGNIFVEETVSITRTGGSDQTVMFEVSGSATASVDTSGDVQILGATLVSGNTYSLVGSNTEITLRILRDPDTEPEETVILTLLQGEGYTIDTTNDNHITTITLVDNPVTTLPLTTIEFASADYPGREGEVVTLRVDKTGASAVTFGLLRTGTADDDDIASVSVGGNPIDISSSGITIPAADSGVDIEITLAREHDQVAPEGEETLTFTLDDPRDPTDGHRVQLGTNQATTITITDVPPTAAPTTTLPVTLIGFASPTYQGMEGTNVTLRINKQGASAVEFSLTITYNHGASQADIGPFSINQRTIAAEDSYWEQVLPLESDDFTPETGETLTLTIVSVRAQTEGHLADIISAQNSTEVTIINATPIPTSASPTTTAPQLIGWAQKDYRVQEPVAGPSHQNEYTEQTISITRTPDDGRSVRVRAAITSSPGVRAVDAWSTYRENDDIALLTSYIGPGQNVEFDLQGDSFRIRVYRDEEAEAEETVTFTLVPGTGYVIDTNNNNHITTVTLVDSPRPITLVEFDTYNNYREGSPITQTIDNNILTVNATEGNQVFLQVKKTGGSRVVFDIVPQGTDSTIEDLDVAGYTAPGNPLEAQDAIPDTRSITLEASEVRLSSDGGGESASLTYAIRLKRDDINEASETLVFELQNARDADSGHRVEVGTVNRLVINVANVPVTRIAFESDAYSGEEGGNATLRVVKTGASAVEFDISITYGSTGATVDDHGDLALTHTIAAGDSSLDLTLPLTEDTETPETGEAITVTITAVRAQTTGHSAQIGTQNSTVVTIINVAPTTTAESTLLSFSQSTVSFMEGELLVLDVLKTGPDVDVTFDIVKVAGDVVRADLDTADATLPGIADHDNLSYTNISFRAGDTFNGGGSNPHFSVRIDRDYITEGNETLTMRLENVVATGGTPVGYGTNREVVVTITDVTSTMPLPVGGDQTITWEQSTYSITEPDAGQYAGDQYAERTITIIRSGGTAVPIVFEVGGDATVTHLANTNADVQIVGATPTDTANQYTLAAENSEFTLRALRDPLTEENEETVTLTLIPGAGYEIPTGGAEMTTVNIVNTGQTGGAPPTEYTFNIVIGAYEVVGTLTVAENTPTGTIISDAHTGGTGNQQTEVDVNLDKVVSFGLDVYNYNNGQRGTRVAEITNADQVSHYRYTLGDMHFDDTYGGHSTTATSILRVNLRQRSSSLGGNVHFRHHATAGWQLSMTAVTENTTHAASGEIDSLTITPGSGGVAPIPASVIVGFDSSFNFGNINEGGAAGVSIESLGRPSGITVRVQRAANSPATDADFDFVIRPNTDDVGTPRIVDGRKVLDIPINTPNDDMGFTTFGVMTLADGVQDAENLLLEMLPSTDGSYTLDLEKSIYTLEIREPTLVAFQTGDSGTHNEGDTFTVVVTKSDTTNGGSVDVRISTDGDATQDDVTTDFSDYTLNIPAADTSATIQVQLATDNAVEQNETLILELSNATPGLSIGAQRQTTITITHVAPAPISVDFESISYSDNEGSTVNVVVEKSADYSAATVTVSLDLGSSTAQAEDISSPPFPHTFTIPNGELTGTIPVVLATDADETEGEQMMNLNLALGGTDGDPDTGYTLQLGQRTQTVITINDAPPAPSGDENAYIWTWDGSGGTDGGIDGIVGTDGEGHKFRVEGRFVVRANARIRNEVYEEHLTEHVITVYRQANGTGEYTQYWKMEYGDGQFAGGTHNANVFLTGSPDNPDNRNNFGRQNTNPGNGSNWPTVNDLHFQLNGGRAAEYREYFGTYDNAAGESWLGQNGAPTNVAGNVMVWRIGPLQVRWATSAGSVQTWEISDRNTVIVRTTGRTGQPHILRETETAHPDPEDN